MKKILTKLKSKRIVVAIIVVILLSLFSFIWLRIGYDGSVISLDFIATFALYVVLSLLLVLSTGSIFIYKCGEYLNKDKSEASTQATPKAIQALYLLCVILTPNIFLFFLYNENHVLMNIPFSYVLLWSVLFSAANLSFFLLLRLIVHSPEARIIISLLFWIGFWLFGSIYTQVERIVSHRISTLILITIIVILAILTRVLQSVQHRIVEVRVIFTVLASCICAVFIFNLYPGLRQEVVFWRARTTIESADGETNDDIQGIYRTNFYIDPTLQNPDIYWFWLDGLMNFETVERFFGKTLNNARYELERRDFIIYENSTINATNTQVSLATIFSPGFFDDFLEHILSPLYNHVNKAPSPMGFNVHVSLVGQGIDLHEINSNNETFRAFEAAGYKIIGNGSLSWFNSSPFHKIYNSALTQYPLGIPKDYFEHSIWDRMSSGDMGRLLASTTPLRLLIQPDRRLELAFFPIPDYSYRLPAYSYTTTLRSFAGSSSERQIYTNLIDIIDSTTSLPKFIFTDIPFTHGFYWPVSSDYNTYPQAFEYALSVMFNVIDIVLDNNPNAIIVLQGDHGIHIQDDQEFLYASGHSHEVIAHLQRSAFSAVRIPHEYGGLDYPLAPLNISRELVNRFVGENYTLLP